MIKQCVLIGSQGSGKTTLFNKLCKQQEKTSSQMDPCTKLITTSQSYDAFLVVDTPGMSTFYDVFQNTIPIVAALTNGPIHRIVLVVQYQKRIEKMLQDLFQIIKLVKQYNQLLVVVVTHFDKCKIEKAEYQIAAKVRIEEQFMIKTVFFTEKNSNGEQLSLDIQNTLFEIGMVVQITDNKFDEMMENYVEDQQLDYGKKHLINELEQFENTIISYLIKFQAQSYQDQILHSLIVFVRKQQIKILENFEKQYGSRMIEIHQKSDNPFKAFYYYYLIKYHVKKVTQKLINLINEKMIYPEDHPFRLLKRCPYCGTIWYQVIGCEITICGDQLLKQEEIQILQQKTIYNEYEFYFENKQEINYQLNRIDDQNMQQKQIEKLSQSLFDDFSTELISKYESRQNNKEKSQESKLNTQRSQGFNSTLSTERSYLTQNIIQEQHIIQPHQMFCVQQLNLNLQMLQKQQIASNKRIGCGKKFDWNYAPLVNIEDLDLNQEEIRTIFSDKEKLYKEDFLSFKREQIKKALIESKKL